MAFLRCGDQNRTQHPPCGCTRPLYSGKMVPSVLLSHSSWQHSTFYWLSGLPLHIKFISLETSQWYLQGPSLPRLQIPLGNTSLNVTSRLAICWFVWKDSLSVQLPLKARHYSRQLCWASQELVGRRAWASLCVPKNAGEEGCPCCTSPVSKQITLLFKAANLALITGAKFSLRGKKKEAELTTPPPPPKESASWETSEHFFVGFILPRCLVTVPERAASKEQLKNVCMDTQMSPVCTQKLYSELPYVTPFSRSHHEGMTPISRQWIKKITVYKFIVGIQKLLKRNWYSRQLAITAAYQPSLFPQLLLGVIKLILKALLQDLWAWQVQFCARW